MEALGRDSIPSSSSPLPLAASDKSLSAVDAGEFLFEAFFTRESDDLLGGFFRPLIVGVPLRPATPTTPLTDPALGPALPARTAPPAPRLAPEPLFGIPGPRDECLAKPLDVVGRFPGPVIDRGPLFVAGPAELSRCLFSMMLAAGVAGAEDGC